MKAVRWILLGVLGGTGLLFLVLAWLGMKGMMALTAQETPIFTAVFLSLGALQLLGGVGAFLFLTWKRRQRLAVLSYGQRVSAVVTELRADASVNVGGKHPWIVLAQCEHPVTRERVTLKSQPGWQPPVTVGQRVEIAFDPMNERLYAFDLPED